MEEDKGKQIGKGRGAILLRLMKEKEQSEDAAIKSLSKSQSQTQYNVPNLSEIPSSSKTGHGRGNLLSTLKSMIRASASSSKPVEVASPGRELSIKKPKAAGYVCQIIRILFSIISLYVFSSFQK